jgi:hypothetical protein
MSRTLAVLVALAVSLVLGGCVDFAPAYKEELLTFDEGLIGAWVADVASEKDGVRRVDRFPVRIEKREAKVTAGRLGEFNPAADGGKPEARPVPAYRFTVSWDDHGVARSKAYDAVMIRVEGAVFLAYQLTGEDPALRDNFGEVLPVHKVLWLERTGDALAVRGMKREVVWLPSIRPLGGEAGEVRLPESGGVWFVSDPDRLTEVLRLAVDTADAWGEATSLKRE